MEFYRLGVLGLPPRKSTYFKALEIVAIKALTTAGRLLPFRTDSDRSEAACPNCLKSTQSRPPSW